MGLFKPEFLLKGREFDDFHGILYKSVRQSFNYNLILARNEYFWRTIQGRIGMLTEDSMGY